MLPVVDECTCFNSGCISNRLISQHHMIEIEIVIYHVGLSFEATGTNLCHHFHTAGTSVHFMPRLKFTFCKLKPKKLNTFLKDP
jgi:hypothetical protein